jgi:hypothetical protein
VMKSFLLFPIRTSGTNCWSTRCDRLCLPSRRASTFSRRSRTHFQSHCRRGQWRVVENTQTCWSANHHQTFSNIDCCKALGFLTSTKSSNHFGTLNADWYGLKSWMYKSIFSHSECFETIDCNASSVNVSHLFINTEISSKMFAFVCLSIADGNIVLFSWDNLYDRSKCCGVIH